MSSKQNQQLVSDLRTVVTRLVKKLRTKSSLSVHLSLTERSVMGLLDSHKELLPSELAAMEKVTTASMSQILAHLLELGYIIRKPSATDGRKAIISLSQVGKDTVLQARSQREEWLLKALEHTTTAEEQARLRSIIDILTKLVDYE
ncbi:DNA-binding transcriptional regulator, MarR family [Chitinophaga costaii]|uniref:DNA-binding transcriptional regulator, MarR family n=1 Tax=Chitinophaga costaii TaxID=1335309 RepID=A0A1C4D871_9BACT|nr:MarR family transcriptional regulator [Chitinophaga costaii]PUZ24501.1 MarR family transcriptional regulator [Chitinophaga costaii]SCC27542.1 DNA-binding transcriptional regulator, MarR family [Chitinophaga costaii]